MNTIPVKDALIEQLEGKIIDTGFGRKLVSGGKFHLVNGKVASLEDYAIYQLRWWLAHSMPGPQEEVELSRIS